MHISKQKINQFLEKNIEDSFFQLICDIKTPQEAREIITNLFTDTELTVFSKRLGIAYYLVNNRDYENISNNLKVSSTTIAKVAKMMKGKGFQMALKSITADEWADKWSKKIKKVFKYPSSF